MPASGKTTFAHFLTKKINLTYRAQRSAGEDIAICIPQDGFHHSRATLDTFPDVQEAYDRRGAAFTFDADGYNELVMKLRAPIPQSLSDSEPTIIRAPSFDHAVKDPVHDSIDILPSARIVIFEGLYTFLDVDPWRRGAQLLDERWFVDADPAKATSRLVLRHVATGVAKDMEEAIWRAKNNDAPNGEYLRNHMFAPTRVIQSIDDSSLVSLGAE